MSVGVIIQARCASTRLPNKILKELPVGSGITVLEQVIRRVRRAKGIKKIVVATTTNKLDDQIVALAKKIGVDVFRGSEDDVLERYYLAAKHYKLSVVVRVTSDCPCIDPQVVDYVMDQFKKSGADYVSNAIERTFVHATDVEIFKFSALQKAAAQATTKPEREHVGVYLHTHPQIFKILNVSAPKKWQGEDIRLTLDTLEDYKLLSKVYDALYPANPYFLIEDVVALFKKKPELKMLNSHVVQKNIFAS